MSRTISIAAGFLMGTCVFAWLAGPMLETQFGTEALLAMYAAVASGVGATTYGLVRKINARFTKSSNSSDHETSRNRGDRNASDGNDDEASGTLTVSLDDLDDLEVEREFRRLKSERSEEPDED